MAAATAVAAALTHSEDTLHGLKVHRFVEPGSGASAVVFEHGATIASYKDKNGVERLYVSPTAVYNGVKAIRGGIPVVFPQFGPDGPLPNHGFARTSTWAFSGVEGDTAVFTLVDSEETRALWDHPFKLELRLRLQPDGFRTELRVDNPAGSSGAFSFQALLHTYHAVPDASSMRVRGLEGVRFLDKLKGGEEQEPGGAPIVIDKEVDSIYLRAAEGVDGSSLGAVEFDAGRTIVRVGASAGIGREGSPAQHEVVVWNAWVDKSKRLGDLPDDGYLSYVCVEPGRVAGRQSLEPAQTFVLTQSVSYAARAGE